MMKKQFLLLFVALLLATLSSWATVRNVPSAYATIQDAIDASVPGDIIQVEAGTLVLASQVNVNKADLTIQGAGNTLTKIQVSGTGYRFEISASGVTIKDMEIEKTDKTGGQDIIHIGASNIAIKNNIIHGQFVIGEGEVSRAMVVSGGLSGLLIDGNTFYGLRQPGYVTGPTTGNISNNYTYGTKGWVMEGGGFTFTGNTWGVNVFDIAIIDYPANAGYFTDIVAMSNANNGAVIEDQRVSPRVLSVVYVDASTAFTTDLGGRYHPYSTIAPAITRVVAGGTIKVAAGTYNEQVTVTKNIYFRGPNYNINPNTGTRVGGEAIINNLPTGRAFTINAGNTDVSIDGFKFDGGSPIHDGNETHFPRTSDVTFRNNIVTNSNNIFSGSDTSWKNVVISNNKFQEVNGATLASAMTIYDALSATVNNNTFTDIKYAAILLDGIPTSTVTGNIINTTGAQAIQLANKIGDATVSNNTITGANSTAPQAADKGAIRMYGSTFTGAVMISGNTISGGYNGITIKDGQDITGKNITVTNNSITGLTAGKAIYHGGTGTLNATCNWFGTSVSSAIAAKISGSVTYIPYSVSNGGACTGYPPPTPITTIGTPTSTTCGTFNVPVTVKDFKNVGSISLNLDYDKALTFTGVDQNILIVGADFEGERSTLSTTTKRFSFSYSGAEFNLNDNDVLFTLKFSAGPGIARTYGLTWSTKKGECEYASSGDVPLVYASNFISSSELAMPTMDIVNTDTHLGFCTIQEAIDHPLTVNGNTITVANGTYVLTSTLNIGKELSIIGASEAGTKIDAKAVTDYGLTIHASNVTLKKFTILPNPTATGSYTIKASPNGALPFSNLDLENITITGSRKTAFDIHGYDDVTLINLTATNTTKGVGIAFTGCKDVTMTGITTASNAWGGIAVYASTFVNRGSSNISLDFALNNIGEFLYVEDEFSLVNSNITVTNWTYGINNDYSTTANYTAYIETPKANALAMGAGLNTKFGNMLSYVWDPTITTHHVGPGMSIQRAIDMAANTYKVDVAAGTYNESVDVNKSVGISGANYGVSGCGARSAESIIQGSFTIGTDGISVDGFEFTGANASIASTAGAVVRSNISIQNNYLHSTTAQIPIRHGLGLGGGIGSTNWNVSNNKISDIQLNNATAIAVFNVTGATINNNCITHTNASYIGRRGINADGLQTATISNNTIDLGGDPTTNVSGYWLIQVSMSDRDAQDITINGNTILNAYFGISTLSQRNVKNLTVTNNVIGPVSVGIALNAGGDAPVIVKPTQSNIVIANNAISTVTPSISNAIGAAVRLRNLHEAHANGPVAFNSIAVNNNSFTVPSADKAIINYVATYTLNATCNWYGTVVANDIALKVSGLVTYSAWLTSGGDGAGIGFQPTGLCDGTPVVVALTSKTDVTCLGGSDGAININVTGGVGTKTYVWTKSPVATTFATTQNLTGLTIGNYNVMVTDANGSTATLSSPVVIGTVDDVTAPVITGSIATSTVFGCSAADAAAVTTVAALEALGVHITENCTAETSMTVQSSDVITPSIGTSPIVVTRTYTVKDATLNTSNSVVQIINVRDDVFPEIVAPANMVVNNDLGKCTAVVNYAAPVGTDNCSGAVTAVTIQTAGLASGSKFPSGVTTNTFKVTDGQGNFATCSFTVTINDNEAPVFAACPANISVNTNGRATCDQIANWTAPTASDNCNPVIISSNYQSGATFPLGTTTVTYTATESKFSVMTGYDAAAVIKGGVRYRNFASDGDAEVFIGTNLGGIPNTTYSQGDFNYNPGYTGTNHVKFEYDPISGDLKSTLTAGSTLVTTFNIGIITNLNYLQIDVTKRITGTTVDFNNVILNGHSLGNFTGSSTWQVKGLDFSASFIIEGDIILTGTQPASAESNKVQLSVGSAAQPPVLSSTCSFNVTVVDNDKPVWSGVGANATIYCPAEPVFSLPNVVDVCDANPKINITTVTTPTSATVAPYSVTRTWTATDAGGNTASVSQTIEVKKATLIGTLKYNNQLTGLIPMGDVDIELYNSANTLVGTTTTVIGTGAYAFPNLCAGTYTFKVTRNPNAGGGINSTDASAVSRWGTTGNWIPQVKFMAGDVSNDNKVTSTDASRIQQYFVRGTAFDRSTWSYWNTIDRQQSNSVGAKPISFSVVVEGDLSYDLYAQFTGDFNGSLDELKSAGSSMMLNNSNSLQVKANQEIELPLRAVSTMEVGAISMILNVPSALVSVQDITVKGSADPVMWAVNGDELRISWISASAVHVTENENLLTLKLKTTNAFTVGQSMEIALKFDPLNELADANSQVIPDASLLVAQVGNGVTGIINPKDAQGLSLSNYPNPFKGSTTVDYQLPVNGKVTINVYNQIGQLVKTLVDGNQNAGDYSIRMDANNLMPGIYIAKLRLTNTNVDLTGTLKLSVLK